MKYLKFFENEQISKKLPNVGDYVLCDESFKTELNNFINNNIGKIIKIEHDSHITEYLVEYDLNLIPLGIKKYFIYNNRRLFIIDEITHHSDNKDDLELILLSKKYNI